MSSAWLIGMIAAGVVAGNADLKGVWRLRPNPFETRSVLVVSDTNIGGMFGSYEFGGPYHIRDHSMSVGAMVVLDTPCLRSERLNANAGRFWRKGMDSVAAADHFRIDGDRLEIVQFVGGG